MMCACFWNVDGDCIHKDTQNGSCGVEENVRQKAIEASNSAAGQAEKVSLPEYREHNTTKVEIISLCVGCIKENCSHRSEISCCPVTICAMRQAKQNQPFAVRWAKCPF